VLVFNFDRNIYNTIFFLKNQGLFAKK